MIPLAVHIVHHQLLSTDKEIVNFLIIAGSVGAGILFLGKAVKMVFAGIRKVGAATEVLIGTEEKPGIDARMTKLELAAEQLHPNGGASVADRIKRIETGLVERAQFWSEMADRLARQEAINNVEHKALRDDIKTLQADRSG